MTPSAPSLGWLRLVCARETLRELKELAERAGDIGPIKRIVEVPEEVPNDEPVVIPDPISEPEKAPVPS